MDELYNVIWAYHTTPRSRIGDSPFRLAYRMDAVILVEIGSPLYRVCKDLNETENVNNYIISLDMLKKRREQAAAIAEAR